MTLYNILLNSNEHTKPRANTRSYLGSEEHNKQNVEDIPVTIGYHRYDQ